MTADTSPNKICFLICPIGEEGSQIRQRSDYLRQNFIEPILTEFGYKETVRADNMPNPGMITTQIIEQIISADLVVVDLAGNNANAFYELAIRHVTRKPVVALYQSGERIPFDVGGMRAIEVSLTEVSIWENAKGKFRAQVGTFDGNDYLPIDTPISTSLDVLALKEGHGEVPQLIAKVIEGQMQSSEMSVRTLSWLAAIRNDLRSLGKPHEIDTKESLLHFAGDIFNLANEIAADDLPDSARSTVRRLQKRAADVFANENFATRFVREAISPASQFSPRIPADQYQIPVSSGTPFPFPFPPPSPTPYPED